MNGLGTSAQAESGYAFRDRTGGDQQDLPFWTQEPADFAAPDSDALTREPGCGIREERAADLDYHAARPRHTLALGYRVRLRSWKRSRVVSGHE
jgi:hypothetical protein